MNLSLVSIIVIILLVVIISLAISRNSSSSRNNPPLPPSNVADRLIELKNLLDQGIITQTDFDEQKRKLLG